MTAILRVDLLERTPVDSCLNLKLILLFNYEHMQYEQMRFVHIFLLTNQFDNCLIHPICLEVLHVQRSFSFDLAKSLPILCTLNLMIFELFAPIKYQHVEDNSTHRSKIQFRKEILTAS